MKPVHASSGSLYPDPSRIKLIRNRYTKTRGEPTLYQISCALCKSPVLLYQKDGGGKLLRCYIDRIHYPKELDPKAALTCTRCKSVLATPMVYEPERRDAFRLIPGSFTKENV